MLFENSKANSYMYMESIFLNSYIKLRWDKLRNVTYTIINPFNIFIRDKNIKKKENESGVSTISNVNENISRKK